jgi:hypothetical protein
MESHFVFGDKLEGYKAATHEGRAALRPCCSLPVHKWDMKDKLWEFPTMRVNESHVATRWKPQRTGVAALTWPVSSYIWSDDTVYLLAKSIDCDIKQLPALLQTESLFHVLRPITQRLSVKE